MGYEEAIVKGFEIDSTLVSDTTSVNTETTVDVSILEETFD